VEVAQRLKMPSRQERRKAERDAAKRAPAAAGAAGATGAAGAATAAARANVDVNPIGDWTTQAEDPAAGASYSRPLFTSTSSGVVTDVTSPI